MTHSNKKALPARRQNRRQTISIRLPKDTYDRLVRRAQEERRSINGQVIHCLESEFGEAVGA